MDNGSTDGSREVIARFCRDHPLVTPILLESNEGGQAINHGLARSQGKLLHLSENDLQYLPGWDEKVIAAFESFPLLGQLSVFGPVPTDEEAWDIKPCSMRFHREQIIYVTEYNVGTSSVLRREVWDKGVRVNNYPTKEGHSFSRTTAGYRLRLGPSDFGWRGRQDTWFATLATWAMR